MNKTPDNWLQSPHLSQVKLVYQTEQQLSSQPVINSPDEAYDYIMSIWDQGTLELQEEFAIILLNNNLKVLGFYKVSAGGKSATIVDISHVVCAAVLSNAHSVILAHNHPGGKLKASSADIQLTRRIYEVLTNVGITLNDHLIITRESYYSFNQHNLIGRSSGK
jgi:DNA repair protein RadC